MIEKINLTGSTWKFGISKEMPDLKAELTDEVKLPSTVSQLKKSPLAEERTDGHHVFTAGEKLTMPVKLYAYGAEADAAKAACLHSAPGQKKRISSLCEAAGMSGQICTFRGF